MRLRRKKETCLKTTFACVDYFIKNHCNYSIGNYKEKRSRHLFQYVSPAKTLLSIAIYILNLIYIQNSERLQKGLPKLYCTLTVNSVINIAVYFTFNTSTKYYTILW